ncbi:MAG: rhodanese-like domain-containing protein [Cyclobacteriaceae bacterium]
MEKKIFSLLALVFILIPALQAQTAYDKKLESLYKNTVPQINPAEVKRKKDEGKQIIILDIRSPEEYAVSHIPDAKFVDYKEFKTEDVRNIDKDAEVVVYCTVGYRSERIGEKLLDMGFTNVKNLYGGIFQWTNEGRMLLNKRNQPTDSVHTYSWWWSSWLERGVKVY